MNNTQAVFTPPTKGELHRKAIYEIIDGFKMFRSCNDETKESLITAFAVVDGKHRFSMQNKLKYTAHNPKKFTEFLVKQKKKYRKLISPPIQITKA